MEQQPSFDDEFEDIPEDLLTVCFLCCPCALAVCVCSRIVEFDRTLSVTQAAASEAEAKAIKRPSPGDHGPAEAKRAKEEPEQANKFTLPDFA